jgi:acyl-CoA reductase-like NAD-dependent aldehyde dehydrogenase
MSTTSGTPVDEHVRGRDFKLLIGGELRDAASGTTATTVDPSTGEAIAAVPHGDAADAAAAVEAAQAAAPAWWDLGVAGRSEVFARFGAALAEQRTRLAMLDAIDGGMPFAAMEVDLAISLANIRDWPPMVRFHGGRTIPASPGNLHYTSFAPTAWSPASSPSTTRRCSRSPGCCRP